jgi:uncharacterized protein (UPF0332 family)
MTTEIRTLINYRVEQADEALDSAQSLLERGNYRTVVNRAYYAMFYAVLALLARTRQQTSKHAWVMTLFDRDFVRVGAFDKDFSRWLHEAFNLRQRADYQELFTVSIEDAQAILEHARAFVAGIKAQLEPQLSAPESGGEAE